MRPPCRGLPFPSGWSYLWSRVLGWGPGRASGRRHWNPGGTTSAFILGRAGFGTGQPSPSQGSQRAGPPVKRSAFPPPAKWSQAEVRGAWDTCSELGVCRRAGGWGPERPRAAGPGLNSRSPPGRPSPARSLSLGTSASRGRRHSRARLPCPSLRPSREAQWAPRAWTYTPCPPQPQGMWSRHLLGLRKHSVNLRKQLVLLEGPSSMSEPNSSRAAAARAKPAPPGRCEVRPPPALGPRQGPGASAPAPREPEKPARRAAGQRGSRGGGGGRGPARAGSSQPRSAGERKSRRRPPALPPPPRGLVLGETLKGAASCPPPLLPPSPPPPPAAAAAPCLPGSRTGRWKADEEGTREGGGSGGGDQK